MHRAPGRRRHRGLMATVRWTPSATRDLEEIFLYIGRDQHSPTAAARVVREIVAKIATYAQQPLVATAPRIGPRSARLPRIPLRRVPESSGRWDRSLADHPRSQGYPECFLLVAVVVRGRPCRVATSRTDMLVGELIRPILGDDKICSPKPRAQPRVRLPSRNAISACPGS